MRAVCSFQTATGSESASMRQTSKISCHSFSTAASVSMPGNTTAAQAGLGMATTHHWMRSFMV